MSTLPASSPIVFSRTFRPQSLLRAASRGVFGLTILVAACLGVTSSASGQPISGRKESRGQIAFDDVLTEAFETIQKERAKKDRGGKLGDQSIPGLFQGMQGIYAVSSTVGGALAIPVIDPSVPSFEAFKASLPKVDFYETAEGSPLLEEAPGATKVTYSIVEQDVLLNDIELRFFYQQSVAVKKGAVSLNPRLFSHTFTSANGQSLSTQGSLRGTEEGGRVVRWKPGSTLTYCVLKWTFGNNTEQYKNVCDLMKEAAGAWSEACNIKFEHRSQWDTVARNTTFPVDAQNRRQVLFVVAHYSAMDAVASAFFPNDSIDERLLLINPDQFYGGKFSQVGVLRHELGHVLGFRHEHISPDAPVWQSSFCNLESSKGSVPLKLPYDRQSVMHYPCDAHDSVALPANWVMALTEQDIRGAQYVYGPKGATAPPANSTVFKDFDASP